MRLLCIPLLALALVAAAPNASAQDPAAGTPGAGAASGPAATSVAGIEANIAEIEASTEIPKEVKATAVEAYRRAIEALQAAEKDRQRIATFADIMANGQGRLDAARAEAARASADPAALLPADVGSRGADELQQLLMQVQARLAEAGSRAAEIDRQLADLDARPAAARDELAAAETAVSQLEDELQQPRPPDENEVAYQARMAALDARMRRRAVEIDRLRQELLSHDLRVELLRLDRDKVARAITAAEQAATAIERRLNDRRRTEAAAAQMKAEQTQAEAEAKHPLLGDAAALNAELTRERQRVAAEISRLTAEQSRIVEEQREVERDFDNARKRVDVAGMSAILGRYLRDQRARVFDTRTYERESALRQEAISSISLRQLEIADQQQALQRPARVAYSMFVNSPAAPAVGSERDRLLGELEELLIARRAILEDLARTYSNQLAALTEIEFDQQRLAKLSAAYSEFLDENLLWVPSSRPVGSETLSALPAAAEWLVSPGGWIDTIRALLDQARRNVGLVLAIALVVLVRIVFRNQLNERVANISKAISRMQTDRFSYTLEAFAITVGVAAAGPALIALVGWWLRNAVTAAEFPRAVGAGALDAGLLLGSGTALLALCQPQGVAARHFRWNNSHLALVRRHLGWWMAVSVPAVFIMSSFGWQANANFNDSLGRLAFLVQAGALTVLVYYLLHPKRGLPSRYVREHRDGWVSRLRHIWFAAAVMFPVGLMVAAAAGFFYTAVRLENRLVATAVVVFGSILAYNFFLRALQVSHRKIQFARAREKREAEQAERTAPQSTTEVGARIVVEEDDVDIDSLNDQTRHLLRVALGAAILTGVYFVWVDVLPALTVLSEVELWRYSGQIDGEATTIPVSLLSVLVIVVVAVLVTIAARNLPAALEIAVLQRLPLDPGLRYAIKTVSQYLIIAIGLIAVLNALGVGWSNIQWLVAALGVGLGFGLQEIVANFVSGLIILFERPFRIGDVITVGNSTGTVTKVRIRATTVLDADNRELIVPNKTFITEQLVNWTLSDAITRVVIPIGIAYDSDVEKAKRVILETAQLNELVLDEPPMRLFFMGLGASALQFELSLYVRALADRLVVTDQILEAIHDALRESGIEIPVPQQDVRIRDIERLEAILGGRRAQPPKSLRALPDAGASGTGGAG